MDLRVAAHSAGASLEKRTEEDESPDRSVSKEKEEKKEKEKSDRKKRAAKKKRSIFSALISSCILSGSFLFFKNLLASRPTDTSAP